MEELESKIWDVVQEACSEYNHPQAVNTVGDAVTKIKELLSIGPVHARMYFCGMNERCAAEGLTEADCPLWTDKEEHV